MALLSRDDKLKFVGHWEAFVRDSLIEGRQTKVYRTFSEDFRGMERWMIDENVAE